MVKRLSVQRSRAAHKQGRGAAMLRIEPAIQIHTSRMGASSFSAIFRECATSARMRRIDDPTHLRGISRVRRAFSGRGAMKPVQYTVRLPVSLVGVAECSRIVLEGSVWIGIKRHLRRCEIGAGSLVADAASLEAEELAQLSVLREAGLVEPSSDDGPGNLIFPMPAGANIESIIRSYDTRDSDGQAKVRCAVCPQHQAHHRGFRVLLDDGRQALIGINCGETQFGAGAWQSALADYERRVQHATYLARVAPALTAIDGILPLMLEWHRKAQKLGSWLSGLRRTYPNLTRRWTDVARRSEGRFERERGRTKTRINRFGREESYRDVEIVQVGKIPFPGMFLGQTPQTPLGLAKNHLESARFLLAKTDVRSLAQAYSQMRQARQAIVDAEDFHQGCLRNCDPSWLVKMCDWANKDSELTVTYAVEGADLIATDELDTEVRLRWYRGNDLGAPPTDQIALLWPE